MRLLTQDEMRFQFRRALQQVSAGTYRDILGAADRREAGLARAVDVFMERFGRYEFRGPDPIPAHGEKPGGT